MAAESPPPSFSSRRKWGLGLHVVLLVLLVLTVLTMLNYLSRDHFMRFHWSTRTQQSLSQRTRRFLSTVTNDVKVILYYDREDPVYSLIADLLNEYKLANPRISVQFVDYLRDPGAALQLQQNPKYSFLASPRAKNLVIFDCGGNVKPVEGNELARYVVEQAPDPKEPYRKRLATFEGEKAFTATLLTLTKPEPFHAYFLQGDGEHGFGTNDTGYFDFAAVLLQNYILPDRLYLHGTNTIPTNCDLLIIAGPTRKLEDSALQGIDQYLRQGNRLFVLFNFLSLTNETGLENLLARWGVKIGTNIIRDPVNFTQHDLLDMRVLSFSKHPIVEPLQLLALQWVLPRAIGRLPAARQTADAPHVDELAFSGPRSFSSENPALSPQSFPLMVAVEKGAITGAPTERGTTRIVVTGDSFFLDNNLIDAAANRNFAGYAVNWLLDRPYLLADIGSRPVTTYQLSLTAGQEQTAQWVLLAGMPGAVLVVGVLVWFRRRR